MFRPLRRSKQALTREACEKLLREQPRGVLALHGEDGYPYAIPMDFLYRDGKLYFHSARAGHKLDAMAKDPRVSFCVMDEGYRREGEWALNIRSVVLFGTLRVLEDRRAAFAVARELGCKYYPDPADVESELQKDFARALILELTVDHMSGKLVNES